MNAATAAVDGRPVMILAGGTGGHIFPGIAVARALTALQVPVVWLGSAGGMETRLVPAHGIAIETLRIGGLRGKGALALVAAPYRLVRALIDALAILRRQRPRSVLSMGGFAAGPGGIAAWLLRRPLIVHEANRAPGFTNRVLAKFARRVLCGFPNSFSGRAETVGNPVRAEVATLPTPIQRFTGRDGTMRLLVLGGSQGARALNCAVPKALAALSGVQVEVRHQCGEDLRAEAIAAYADVRVPASIEPFIQDMAAAYGWADLVVCRAGAMTLAEVCAAGVGALLVPFPLATDDHQTRNAEYLVERGAARLLPQHADLDAHLHNALAELLLPDRLKLLAMAECARAAALPNATANVAAICIEEARP